MSECQNTMTSATGSGLPRATDDLKIVAALTAENAALKAEADAQRREIRRYVEGNGFAWQDESSTAFNATTAIGWLGGTIEALQSRVAELERVLKEDPYKHLYNRAIDAVDHVFQVDSTRPPPLLPDFVQPGEDKFKGVAKLAHAYIALRADLAAANDLVAGLESELRSWQETSDGFEYDLDEKYVEIKALKSRVAELGLERDLLDAATSHLSTDLRAANATIKSMGEEAEVWKTHYDTCPIRITG